MQFVSVLFNPWDRRSYTYHWNGEKPLASGDRVYVITKDGQVEVTVETAFMPKPDFETKPIVGRVE